MKIKKYKGLMISVMVFLYAVIALIRYNSVHYNTMYLESPDGNLYLSIAENFLQSGHFIQNIRAHEENMVVPFGTPLLYTIFIYIFRSIYPIVVIQYLVYGVSVTLLAQAARKISRTYLACFISAPFFVYFRNVLKEPNPGYLLTETYTMFILCLFIFLLVSEKYSEKRIVMLYAAAFAGYCFRPVIGIIMLVPILLGIADLVKSVIRKTGEGRHKIFVYGAAVLASIVILLINGGINYRETGKFVLIENYGGIPAYQANNANTKTAAYSSDLAHDFADDYFFEVYENPDIDMNQKNELLSRRVKEFIFSNLGFVLKNAKTRYIQLYHMPEYGFSLTMAGLCTVILWIVRKTHRKCCVLLALSFIGATAVPAFGLYIVRYGIACIPFYSLAYGGVASVFITMFICKVYLVCQERLKQIWK